MPYRETEVNMLGKTFRAKFRKGHIELVEPVEFPEEVDLLVTAEEAAAANRWFERLHTLFAPVRCELSGHSEATIDRRIARAVKTVRARKRAKT